MTSHDTFRDASPAWPRGAGKRCRRARAIPRAPALAGGRTRELARGRTSELARGRTGELARGCTGERARGCTGELARGRAFIPSVALPLALALAASFALAACASSAPNPVPPAPAPAAWSETVPGWIAAAPADTLSRGPWWSLFGDATLDRLAPQVAVSNQTLAGAAAALDAARAAAREQRAGFFPTIGLGASATRSGSEGTPATAANTFHLGGTASWEPDLWGRVAASTTGADASARASEADLAAATLSAQGAFVTDYLGVREADAEIALLEATLAGYAKALEITQHRYDAGLAARTDILQAQTQLATTRSSLAALQRQRAQLVHALAVLAGSAPGAFTMPAAEGATAGVGASASAGPSTGTGTGTGTGTSSASALPRVPAVPVGLPSALLQRRPDIAAAQRRVAAANAGVGVARSAWFPALTLSGSAGPSSARLSDLLDAKSVTWSFGLAIAGTLFDGGLRSAQVDAAQAAWRQSVASYRQATLAAFQEVEDALVAAETLQRQEDALRQAADAATQAEEKMLNRYRQGQQSYGDVVATQIASLSARRALLQASLARQQAAVSLVLAVGGGWQDAASTP